MVSPLAVVRDADNELTLRGAHLDETHAVRLADPLAGVEVQIRKKEKTGPPNGLTAEKVGDTELVVALRVPADAPESLRFVVTATGGEAVSPPVAVFPRDALLDEIESNGGFRDAQPLALGQTVRGVVSHSRDVDTYRVASVARQAITVEVTAARAHSPLDPLVMLYDDRGQLIAIHDDGAAGSDVQFTVQLPSAGTYFLALLDAHDAGSALHAYRLTVRPAEP